MLLKIYQVWMQNWFSLSLNKCIYKSIHRILMLECQNVITEFPLNFEYDKWEKLRFI